MKIAGLPKKLSSSPKNREPATTNRDEPKCCPRTNEIEWPRNAHCSASRRISVFLRVAGQERTATHPREARKQSREVLARSCCSRACGRFQPRRDQQDPKTCSRTS